MLRRFPGAPRARLGARSLPQVFLFAQLGVTPFWKVLLQNLAARAEAQSPLRLLIELHAGGGSHHALWSALLPDILALRALFARRFAHLGAGGCPVRLGTLLRRPLEQALSLHRYALAGRSPLCMWPPPGSLQLRLLLGLPYNGPRHVHLSAAHARSAWAVLDGAFDAVGVLEVWEQSAAELAAAFGLRRLVAPTVNVAARPAALGGGALPLVCNASHGPTVAFVRGRMEASAATALGLARKAARRARLGRGAGAEARVAADGSGGAAPAAERVVACKSGGCLLPRALLRAEAARARRPAGAAEGQLPGLADGGGVLTGAEEPAMAVSATDRRWDASDCAQAAENADAARVLLRLCASLRHDTALHAAARARLAARAASPSARARAEAIRAANARPPTPGRASRSCPACTRLRASMLDHCWRALPTWAPDPQRFACERRWHGEGPRAEPSAWTLEGLAAAPAPCFRTCWEGDSPRTGGRHCTASCDGDDAQTDPTLAPSPQPPAQVRSSLRRVLRTPPDIWYARWEAEQRPRLLGALAEPVRSALLAPLDWGRFELEQGADGLGASWPPGPWAEPLVPLGAEAAPERGAGGGSDH